MCMYVCVFVLGGRGSGKGKGRQYTAVAGVVYNNLM